MGKVMWKDFCRELGEKILEYKQKKDDLKEILKETVETVNIFKKNMEHVENNGMDPFTFLVSAVTVAEEKRKEIFKLWKNKFNITLW